MNLGADADGEEFAAEGVGTDGAGGGGVLFGREVQVPGGGVVETGVAEFANVAGEAGGFGLEVGVGGGGGFAAEEIELSGGGEGDSDKAGDAGEAEEFCVAASGVEAAGAGEVDEDIRLEAADLEGEAEELADGAGAGGVAHVAVDEAGVFEHGGGGRSFGGDGEVGEEAALGGREGARDEVERGKGDKGVAETAEAVDEDAPGLIIQQVLPDVRHELQCRTGV